MPTATNGRQTLKEIEMRNMPTIISGNPSRSDVLQNDSVEVPVAETGQLSRAIDLLAGGNLTDAERKFVERASDHNWTIRVIVEELRERRGMVPVPTDFDWRTV